SLRLSFPPLRLCVKSFLTFPTEQEHGRNQSVHPLRNRKKEWAAVSAAQRTSIADTYGRGAAVPDSSGRGFARRRPVSSRGPCGYGREKTLRFSGNHFKGIP
ncbi:MAG: hypothetical protein L0Y32_04740, partial [Nevskiales bacterium]|nr:hypothetical protein [Nevskiales bacterium]